VIEYGDGVGAEGSAAGVSLSCRGDRRGVNLVEAGARREGSRVRLH